MRALSSYFFITLGDADFEKKMIVIATLYLKLQTVKDLVRPLFKKQRFRESFDNQHVKES